jgi:hypothetical protein
VKNFLTARFRNRPTIFLIVLLLVGMLSACSTGLTVRSDIDPTVDFGQYNAYNFFEPMGIEGGYNSPIFGEHFRASMEMTRSRCRRTRRLT